MPRKNAVRYKLPAETPQSTPSYLLSHMDDERFRTFEQQPTRVSDGPLHHTIVSTLFKSNPISDASPQLERMGAMLLACSFVEGRIRAAYRDRHAIINDIAFKDAQTEQDEFTQARKKRRLIPHSAIATDPLNTQVVALRRYNDIDDQLCEELLRFVKIRNAIAHDAMYRLDAFKADIVLAVQALVGVTVKMRNRVKTRTRNERQQHMTDPYAAQYFASLVVGNSYTRDELFHTVAGSLSLCVPISHNRPLYVVTQSNALQIKVERSELSMHKLWEKFVQPSSPRIPVFQKTAQGGAIVYRGYGRISHQDRVTSDAVYLQVEMEG
jgi:hypothetical protein